MGRDSSTGTIGFDGVGLTTSVGRSLDPALYDEMESALLRVARHYHPRRAWAGFLTGRDPDGLFTVHPLGGCSMGRTAADGFTDHLGQVFGYPGLFVADGSLYPRSPGIAPSMTIAALAERQASLMA
jgi:cholesterol oxidase